MITVDFIDLIICFFLIGDARNAESMGITEQEAKKLKKDFLSKHPALTQFRQAVVKSCRERGYVETILGRRRLIEV
jgi:DNA polymerase-1